MKSWKTIKNLITLIGLTLTILLAGYLYDSRNIAFLGYNPHPFLVLSVALSAFYGLNFSIISSVFLSIFYLIVLHVQLDYEAVETIWAYKYISTPFYITLLSIVVGEFKQRSINEARSYRDRSGEEGDIIQSLRKKNEVMKREVNEIKSRLVTKIETFGSLQKYASKLSVLETNQLYKNVLEILNDQIEVHGVAFYKYSKDTENLNLEETYFESDKYETALPRMINVFDSKYPMINEVFAYRRMVTIKDILNKEKFESSSHTFVLTYPVIVNEEFYGVLGITSMPFLKYIPSSFKMAGLIVDWFSASLEYAIKFQKNSQYAVIDPDLNIYKFGYFTQRLEEELEQAQMYKLPVSLLSIELQGIDGVSDNKKMMINKLISELTSKSIKKIDFMTLGPGNTFYVALMSKSNEQVAELVEYLEEEFLKFNITNSNDERIMTKVRQTSLDGEVLDFKSLRERLH